MTDDAARDERGRATSELFKSDARAKSARFTLAATLSVDADRATNGIGAVDAQQRAGERIARAIDSLAPAADLVVVDVVDRGTRDGHAPWVLLGAMRAATPRHMQVVVLDRANPLTGEHAEGPAPDSVTAASDALYGLPARHGMTVGEVAKWLNVSARIGANLTVVPVRGWRRGAWSVQAVRVGGADASPDALLLRGAFALFAATNVDVIVGPGRNEITVGAPWLDAKRVSATLADRLIPDAEFSDRRARIGDADLPAIRVTVTDRERATGSRIAVAVLAAIHAAHPGKLTIDSALIARITGTPRLRPALLGGDDADAIVDRDLPNVVAFRRRSREAMLYR